MKNNYKPGYTKYLKMKKIAAIFFCAVFSFLTLAVLVSAYDSGSCKDAPGGEVYNADDLIAALGGEDAAGIFGDRVMLKSDIRLLNTVTILRGSYMIDGGDCTIARGFDGGFMISVGVAGEDYSETAPELILGYSGAYAAEDTLIIDGGSENAVSDFLGSSKTEDEALSSALIRVYGSLRISDGTVIKNSGSCAIYNSGETYADGLEIENCVMPVYNDRDFSMISCRISGCAAKNGGAVFNAGKFAASECTFERNFAERGGDIYNAAQSSDSEEDRVIYSNANEFISSSASDCGGCIYNEANFLDSGSRIDGCTSKLGGFIYNTGSFETSGIFAQGCNGENGGFAYNNGRLVLGSSGTVDECKADKNGGGVYNDKSGELFISGTMLSSNSAAFGGGVFNLGETTFSGGTLTYNKADIGEAILNDGRLYMTGSPVSNENNDIFIVTDGSAEHAIQIKSAITAPYTARLTPGICENGEYKKSYKNGAVLIAGEYAKDKYTSFSVSESGSSKWELAEDGTISGGAFYNQIWFYAALCAAIAVLISVFVILKNHRKKSKTTAAEGDKQSN